MKALDYMHSYRSKMTEAQEMQEKFGDLIVDFDESADYEVNQTLLFKPKNGRGFNLLFANGCSCWDGDYDGWYMNKAELTKWAKANVDSSGADKEMAKYIIKKLLDKEH